MRAKSRKCAVGVCPEMIPANIPLCVEHDVAWMDSPEARRAHGPMRYTSALSDFARRIDAEMRNGGKP